ncbi:MAG: hypothetical protein KDJ47_15515 [Hyphomicrobiaceae bacterium]|nr:hypothetical protein [Hyphomicrobiaceae bacterium]
MKNAISSLPVNVRGRRRYPRKLREAIVVALGKWQAAGGKRVDFVAAVGVDGKTLAGWNTRKKLVEVAIVTESPAAGVVVSPSGYRVEGLTLEQMASLLGALR